MGKIAVIDSGVGGLTVMKEIIKQLPNEDIVYFGDQKNCPYGDKTKTQICQYVFDIVNFLAEFEIKALVIACNTATAVVLDQLTELCNYPVIGVIEPGAQYALEKTKNKKIGVIATAKTVESEVYAKTLTLFDSTVEVHSQPCPKIVPLIENEPMNEGKIHLVLEEYLFPFKAIGIDTLILGCTHYPIITKNIERILGGAVQMANPAIRTATKLKEVLYAETSYRQESVEGSYLFYTSGEVESFNIKATTLLGMQVESKKEDTIFVR